MSRFAVVGMALIVALLVIGLKVTQINMEIDDMTGAPYLGSLEDEYDSAKLAVRDYQPIPGRIAVLSDTGGGNEIAESIVKAIRESRPEKVIHIGDMVTTTGNDYIGWYNHIRLVKNLCFRNDGLSCYKNTNIQESDYYPVLGNHDIERDDKIVNMIYGFLDGTWDYAIRNKDFNLLVFDVTSYDGAANLDEVERLSKIAGSWENPTIIAHHIPSYSLNKERNLVEKINRQMEMPVKYSKACLILNGHNHYYHRYEHYNTTVINNGGGGYKNYYVGENFKSASQRYYYGNSYVIIDIKGKNLSVNVFNETGGMIDSFEKHCN